jgi:hypothetical protein
MAQAKKTLSTLTSEEVRGYVLNRKKTEGDMACGGRCGHQKRV